MVERGVKHHKPLPKTSITEPGYYEDGKFGIRIENLILVKKADTEVYCVIIL